MEILVKVKYDKNNPETVDVVTSIIDCDGPNVTSSTTPTFTETPTATPTSTLTTTPTATPTYFAYVFAETQDPTSSCRLF